MITHFGCRTCNSRFEPELDGPIAAPAIEATTADAQPVRPVLPRGQAPRFLIGQWSGGPGGKTGRYLIVTADGRYERGYEQGDVESAGAVVANNDAAVFYDAQGGREQAALTYTDVPQQTLMTRIQNGATTSTRPSRPSRTLKFAVSGNQLTFTDTDGSGSIYERG